jgi:hypothetical protein
MLRRRLWGAAATLALLAAASWLPAIAASRHHPPVGPDLARPAVPTPAQRPLRPANAADAVRDFFLALGTALAAEPGVPPRPPSPAATPAPSASAAAPPGEEAVARFAAAYSYLAPAWRDRLPFTDFAARWRPLRRLELLTALPAGHPPFDRRVARVFVEVRALIPAGEGVAVGFRYGFFTVEPGPEGWRLTGGGLHPEGFDTAGPGAAPDPEVLALEAARSEATRRGFGGTVGPVTLQPTAHGHQWLATVRVGTRAISVRLYRLVDGNWVALETVV